MTKKRLENAVVICCAVAAVGYFLFTTPLIANLTSTLPLGNRFINPTATLAWGTWTNYVTAAGTHDLATVKKLSHQISPTCADPSKEAECLMLMEGVVFFGGALKPQEFSYIQSDEKQIIMYTPYVSGMRKILYFTRDSEGTPKVLGLRFCGKGKESLEVCLDSEKSFADTNENGWWDVTEAQMR
jgi:hypothetical protein